MKIQQNLKFLFSTQEILIKSFNYEVEVHQVQTQDGYKLNMHRILPKKVSAIPRLGPVFVMHGLTATSGDPLMTGAEIGLRKKHLGSFYTC